MSVKESFEANVNIRLGDGRNMLFWNDKWTATSSLAAQFPNLYACANDKFAKASAYMALTGDHILWGPIFRNGSI